MRHIKFNDLCNFEPGSLLRDKKQSIMVSLLAPLFVTVLAAGATPALADLKLCNTTPSRIGVAVGYQDPKGWATEGWWTIPSKSCETLLKGKLPSRFYYIHAIDYDRGGEWKGTSQMCTARQSFIIRGVEKCQSRGYKQTGFFEVDTGNARNWTIRLSDPVNKATAN